ncbi:hypothetical protein KFL_007830030 [Klebsormidium nitens]|uniref:Secreted protein n=1 Tax=Klebsormidium nitens TaxID=105231 RepID=A0A1Y1IRR1_KLENI|nr:hypothetical protein KFL_007830030 [Klebsormidium nitens]|eukprot:GAQ91426.1 hypothetical protein KFL_007830030 [Klebsormidium nitens]
MALRLFALGLVAHLVEGGLVGAWVSLHFGSCFEASAVGQCCGPGAPVAVGLVLARGCVESVEGGNSTSQHLYKEFRKCFRTPPKSGEILLSGHLIERPMFEKGSVPPTAARRTGKMP